MKLNKMYLAMLSLLAASLFLGACGKKDSPQPQETRYKFSWAESAADISNGCLSITARLDGAYENAESFMLEVEPVTDGICLDCPFKPAEFFEVTPVTAEEGLYTFQYCPETQAEVYRWRLLARNLFRGLSHAQTPVQLAKPLF